MADAYAFNLDRSKAPVYTKEEIDQMDLVNDQALAQEVSDRQAAVNGEIGLRSAGDAALGNRIDNIIASAGDGTIPTELSDIRTDFAGIVHTTASNAINKNESDNDLLLRGTFGEKRTKIAVTGGTTHPSSKDRVYFPVSPGDIVIFNMKKSANCTIQIWDDNNSNIATYTSSYTDVDFAVTIANSSSTFGFYIDSAVSQVIEIGMSYKSSSIMRKIKEFDGFEKANRFAVCRFSVSSGNSHSSTIDKVDLTVSEGEWIRILNLSSGNVTPSSTKNGSSVESYGTVIPNTWYYFKASGDIDQFGVYVGTVSQQKDFIVYIEVLEHSPYFNYDEFVKANFSKNLIGPEAGKLYPVPMLHKGQNITLSTMSGEALVSPNKVTFRFYNEKKEQVDAYDLRSMDTGGVRTIALTSTHEGVCWISKSNYIPVQFELSNSASTREAFYETDYVKALLSDYSSIVYSECSYNLVQGSTHSSTVDKRYVDIKQGEKFYILAMCSNANAVSYFTPYVIYSDDTSDGLTSLSNNDFNSYIADKDIVNIGFYNPSATVNDTAHLYILKDISPFVWLFNDHDYDFVNSRATSVDPTSAMESFAAGIVGLEETEQFLFFTDPHIFQHSVNEKSMEMAIGTIEKTYNNSPTSFVLCGGDWLDSYDTASEAAYKLGRIDGIMRAKFHDRYYPILGNHDTNYQGASHQQTPYDFTDMISNESLMLLWFREYGSNYYDFVAPGKTRFYVFDSQLDWYTDMDDYKWEQCQWYASKLLENDDEHSVIALHIIKNYADDNVLPFATQLTAIAQAYNARTTISVNGTSYNFSAATGKVAFMIGGHLHSDLTGTTNNIPWLITTNTTYTPRFDLCLVDYDNGKLKTFRVGEGSDREISIVV